MALSKVAPKVTKAADNGPKAASVTEADGSQGLTVDFMAKAGAVNVPANSVVLVIAADHPYIAGSKSSSGNAGVMMALFGSNALDVPGLGAFSLRGWCGLGNGMAARSEGGALAVPAKARGKK
jgi:hypothetical protein